MWLKMDLEGIEICFRIAGYKKSTKDNCYDEWCKVDLAVKAGDWLNYHVESSEMLLAMEVETLKDAIDDLLNDRLEQPNELGFIEPDIEFELYPKEDLRNNPRFLYIAPGNEIADIYMELVISFWHNGLTANRLIMGFVQADMEKLECYLKYIIGIINKDDAMVQKMIADGEMYE